MTQQERENIVRPFIGKTVRVEIDRPMGYVHHKGAKTLVYPVNYGYIPAGVTVSAADAAAELDFAEQYYHSRVEIFV